RATACPSTPSARCATCWCAGWRAESVLRGVILSDVNCQNLAGHLENDPAFPQVSVQVAPFGQIAQTILGGDPELFAGADFAVLWTSPAGVIEGFRELSEQRGVAQERWGGG